MSLLSDGAGDLKLVGENPQTHSGEMGSLGESSNTQQRKGRIPKHAVEKGGVWENPQTQSGEKGSLGESSNTQWRNGEFGRILKNTAE